MYSFSSLFRKTRILGKYRKSHLIDEAYSHDHFLLRSSFPSLFLHQFQYSPLHITSLNVILFSSALVSYHRYVHCDPNGYWHNKPLSQIQTIQRTIFNAFFILGAKGSAQYSSTAHILCYIFSFYENFRLILHFMRHAKGY